MLTTYKYEEIAPEAEGLIVPVTASELEALKEGQPFIQPAIDKQLQQMLSSGILKAKTGNTAAVATLGLLPQQMVVITVIDEAGAELREAFAQAAGKVKSNKLNTLAIDISSSAVSGVLQQAGIERAVKCMLEGLKLTLIGRQVLKKQEQSLFEVQQISFVLNDDQLGQKSIIEAAVQEAECMTESVKLARDLTNMSGNELTPERLAFYAEEVAQKLELDIEVLDEWSCAEEQMGGLLGVGQGSVNPPRMIVIHYEGNPESEEKWGIVGKGITFDTGGISLKPAAGMEDMISDMGGAAAVLGAIHAIASMKVKANVLAVIPTAENMPSDRALKPGDVIRTMSGHTVEVVNTDAEGRLVLADGITTAIKRGATKLVDVATLTGAVLVALGTEATGAVTNDKSLMEKVIAASEKSGERIWQ